MSVLRLMSADMDPEVLPEATTFSTVQRLHRFSTWRSFSHTVSTNIRKARSVAKTHGGNTVNEHAQTLTLIIKTTQDTKEF